MRELNRQACAHCGTENKSRNRDFSAQIWAVLLYWGEVDDAVVNQPICDSCYRELRNLLIDRSEEMENVLKNGLPEAQESRKTAQHVAGRTKTPDKKDGKEGKKLRAKIPKAS